MCGKTAAKRYGNGQCGRMEERAGAAWLAMRKALHAACRGGSRQGFCPQCAVAAQGAPCGLQRRQPAGILPAVRGRCARRSARLVQAAAGRDSAHSARSLRKALRAARPASGGRSARLVRHPEGAPQAQTAAGERRRLGLKYDGFRTELAARIVAYGNVSAKIHKIKFSICVKR